MHAPDAENENDASPPTVRRFHWTPLEPHSDYIRTGGSPMRTVRISENFVPISELKAAAAEWLQRLNETDAPVVVTQNGVPAAVMLSPRAFDELTERARVVSAVEAGLADLEAGRVVSHDQLKREMKARFGRKPR